MPHLRIEIFEGRDAEKKQKLAEALTEAVCRTLEVKPDDVTITIEEFKRENWAKGGRLFSDPAWPVKKS